METETEIYDYKRLTVVGTYISNFNEILQINLPCTDVLQSDGLIKHIHKRHKNCVQYMDRIKDIISKPDYIGKHPDKENSIELIKCYEKNLLVAIELDMNKNYLYVSSFYDLKESKLERRLQSGRIKIFKY